MHLKKCKCNLIFHYHYYLECNHCHVSCGFCLCVLKTHSFFFWFFCSSISIHEAYAYFNILTHLKIPHLFLQFLQIFPHFQLNSFLCELAIFFHGVLQILLSFLVSTHLKPFKIINAWKRKKPFMECFILKD